MERGRQGGRRDDQLSGDLGEWSKAWTKHPSSSWAVVTSLSGYEIGRMPRLPRISEQPEPHSPMRLQVCSQMWFDPILQRFARMFPQVRLQYRTRLESFATSENGVSAEVVDLESGQRQHIEANYLVGCDGANSVVRRSLGIGL